MTQPHPEPTIFERILASFDLAAVLDILVVSLLAYLLIAWARRARSRFVLAGLAVLAAIYVAARLLELQLTLYLLQAVVTVAAVAMVVIFQEDIRRGFERLVARLRGGQGVRVDDQLVDVLASSVASLAERRIGALLVLPGREPLDRHLREGEELRGVVSETLLDSLFDPGSAGHDGAVVIEGGLVARFGVHLPLSGSVGRGLRLGTRHAAALGLAERCDALVIVVSEERGTISLAHDGRLLRMADARELRARIDEHLAEDLEERQEPLWRALLRRNLGTKALAFAVALGVWMVTFGLTDPNMTRIVTAPVLHRHESHGDWIIERMDPTDLKVTLAGSGRVLRELDPSAVRIVTQMDPLEEGWQLRRVTPEDVEIPLGVSVLRVEPASVTFVARRTTEVEVRVEPAVRGEVVAGMRLKELRADPESVTLVVPLRSQESYQTVRTEPVELGSVRGDDERRLDLVLPKEARLAEGEPAAVDVHIAVAGAEESAATSTREGQ